MREQISVEAIIAAFDQTNADPELAYIYIRIRTYVSLCRVMIRAAAADCRLPIARERPCDRVNLAQPIITRCLSAVRPVLLFAINSVIIARLTVTSFFREPSFKLFAFP